MSDAGIGRSLLMVGQFMADIRALALIGVALPFGLAIMLNTYDGVLGANPLVPVLVSFFIALGMYLPWINQTFKQYGLMTVGGIAFAALVIHFVLAFIVFVILFVIVGDTI